jgi:predicted DNA-binding WGR domain protein
MPSSPRKSASLDRLNRSLPGWSSNPDCRIDRLPVDTVARHQEMTEAPSTNGESTTMTETPLSPATIVTIRAAELVDPRAGNDKFYRVFVAGSSWCAQYGRNGTVGTFTKLVDAGTTEDAHAAANAKFIGKLKKGYTETRAGVVNTATAISELDLTVLDSLVEAITPTGTPSAARHLAAPATRAGDTDNASVPDVALTVSTALRDAGILTIPATTEHTNPTLPVRPMLASTLELAELAAVVDSSAWFAQFKYDGDRVVVVLENGGVTVLNRQGQPKTRNVGAAHLRPLSGLRTGRWVFDGEVVGRTLVLFDLITATDGAETWAEETTPFATRYRTLAVLCDELGISVPADTKVQALDRRSCSRRWPLRSKRKTTC